MSSLNTLAQTLKSLHVPGKPLILANVYDLLSAQAISSLSSCKALATASYAVARANGTEDDAMTLETNLTAISLIGKEAIRVQKPLTVDIQDGYGSQLEDAIKGLIKRGAVGCNLEDCDKESQKIYPVAAAVDRIKKVLSIAKNMGVPDFVVNARCDALIHGGELDDVIQRGKQYLAAGATTVFVWGGSKRGVHDDEVKKMVEAFGGRLNVAMKMSGDDSLSVSELSNIGVARISVGPQIQFMAMEFFGREAEKVLHD
ncbi:Phosphoenolpyruvate/pyruvate domain-containing protein [Polyplosphaeria fusca]|uniref:Phosphoenolpyruvate/pyruvate domain-containing protein n=1 Tax=Polyplosphaeria fusca TaxID=682080 RepID=A0A9P4QZN1_9PLEO|nr:Phosphoenolpyruvate/pyruvate domain-containing protein [Polyplosphaeria fusca]